MRASAASRPPSVQQSTSPPLGSSPSSARPRSAGGSSAARSHAATSAAGDASITRLRRWDGEGRFGRLGHAGIALPAFVFELDVLDRDGVGIRVEIRQSLIFGYPAAVNLVRDHLLPGLIENVENEVFAEILERHFGRAAVELPDFVRPLFETQVVSNPALERDRIVLGAARRLAARTGVAAFAVFDHFGRALERAHLTDPGHVFPIPLDPEFKVLIRIVARRINRKLRHDSSLLETAAGAAGIHHYVAIWPVIC